MSERPHGMKALEELRGGGIRADKVHMAKVHSEGFGAASVQKETKTHKNKSENGIVRQARAEVVKRNKKDAPVSADHLLAELEEINEQIEDAQEDGNRDQLNNAQNRKAVIEAQLRDMRDTPAVREKLLADHHATLRPTKEYMSPLMAYRDAVQRYTSLHADLSGGFTPTSQRINRDLENRMQELLPEIAKNEIATDLRTVPLEKYRKMVEVRLTELEALEQDSASNQETKETVERNLLKEKLRQLEKQQPKSFDGEIAKQKAEMRTLRSEITRTANRIVKLENERQASWNPMKRWNLAIQVRDLREERAATMRHLRELENLNAEWQKSTSPIAKLDDAHIENFDTEIDPNDLEAVDDDLADHEEERWAAK